jgi:prevent-host-death family protein
MKTVTATDAKREFGELLIDAQKGPVGINRNGKPIAVIMSATDYALLEELRESRLRQSIEEGVEDLRAGRISSGKEVFGRLRQRLSAG